LPTSTKVSLEQLSDETLIHRVARGEPTALEILYERHAAMILGICLKIIGDQVEAESILQETFWQIWRGTTSYKAERGSFQAWLFKLARNLALDVYRQRSSKLDRK